MKIFSSFKKGKKMATDPKSEKVAVEPQAETGTTEAPKGGAGTKRVHNLIVLDESGSMQSIYHPALTGVNETLQTIREAQKGA